MVLTIIFAGLRPPKAPERRPPGGRKTAGQPGRPGGHPGFSRDPAPPTPGLPTPGALRRPPAGGHLCARGPKWPPGRLGAAPMRACARPRVLCVPGGGGRHTHHAVTSAGSEREAQLDPRPRPPLRSSAVTTRPPARLPASRAGPTRRPERPGHSPGARPERAGRQRR